MGLCDSVSALSRTSWCGIGSVDGVELVEERRSLRPGSDMEAREVGGGKNKRPKSNTRHERRDGRPRRNACR